MRIVVGILALMLGGHAAAESATSTCLENARTQLEMNQCAGDGYKAADAELNRIYAQIQKVYADDPKFLAKLKEAQHAWIKLRDADLAMMYPSPEGSIAPFCQAQYLEKLTRERISTLEQWLLGAEEGDTCAGSIKLEDNLE